MKVTIRQGRREDIPAVYALVKELAEYEKAPGEVTNTIERMTEDAFGKNPCYYLLVAEAEGVIAGMAVFFIKYSTWKGKGIYLDDIIVSEKFRRKSIGRLLFDAVIRKAAETGAHTMHWQVLDWNTPAIEFYKKYDCTFENNWIDCKLTRQQILSFASGKPDLMPSFDIVSKTDIQKLDNALNVAKKEISTRYDFHDSKSEIEFDKKAMNIHIVTENDLRMKAIQDIIIGRSVKQGVDPACFDFGREQYASGSMLKKDIKVKQGIEKETARKIVKLIKDTGLKVQASIQDDQVRVSGKKIDDLQQIIAMLKGQNLGLPLQYENFRS